MILSPCEVSFFGHLAEPEGPNEFLAPLPEAWIWRTVPTYDNYRNGLGITHCCRYIV